MKREQDAATLRTRMQNPKRSLSKKSGGIKVRATQANEMCSTRKDQINTELLAIFKGTATGASA
jgi:hypothetical protein